MTLRAGRLSVPLALGLGFALACGGGPDLSTPKSVHTKRVSFEHPRNWTVHSETGRNEGLFLGLHEVEGHDAMIFIQAYDAQAPFAPSDVADMYIDSLPDHMEGMELEVLGRSTATATVAGAEREGAEVRFAGTLLGVAVPHTLQVFTLKSETRTATVIVQVPDEDAAVEQPGIDLVLRSLELY